MSDREYKRFAGQSVSNAGYHNHNWDLFHNGNELRDVSFPSLAAALKAIGTENKTLVITRQHAVTASMTIPANVFLVVLWGGSFNISTGKNLAIAGSFWAGIYQVFYGAGTYSFTTTLARWSFTQWAGASLAATGTFNGNVVITGTLDVTGIQTNFAAITFAAAGVSQPWSIFRSNINGLFIRGGAGSSYDLHITSASSVSLIRNPTGTSILQFAGLGGCEFSGPVTASGTLGTTGLHTAAGGISITGGSNAVGSIFKDAFRGLALRGVTGSADDFSVRAADGTIILQNPTGTTGITLPTAVTAASTVDVTGGNLVVARSASGSTVLGAIRNDANTASSQARLLVQTAGASADDAFASFVRNGSDSWSIGLDASASNVFKLSQSTALGTNDRLTVGSSGVTVAGTLTQTGVATFQENVIISTLGKGLRVKAGTNGRINMGNVLVAGTVTVSNTSVTANTMISWNRVVSGGTLGHITITRNAGVGYTITSSSATETSTIDVMLTEAT